MRERWARWLAIFTGTLVLLLSAAFAWWQNHGTIEQPAPAGGTPATVTLQRGRAIYESQGCMRCHSIAGRGSPRSPLDGIADRLGRDELRGFVVGDPQLAASLPARVRASKQDYAAIPPDELDALLDYLQSLGVGDRGRADAVD